VYALLSLHDMPGKGISSVKVNGKFIRTIVVCVTVSVKSKNHVKPLLTGIIELGDLLGIYLWGD